MQMKILNYVSEQGDLKGNLAYNFFNFFSSWDIQLLHQKNSITLKCDKILWIILADLKGGLIKTQKKLITFMSFNSYENKKNIIWENRIKIFIWQVDILF